MRKILLLSVLIISNLNLTAQQKLFVRVYNLYGKKVYKGYIESASDSLMVLKHGKTLTVDYKNIGSIKTKHSEGNNVLVGIATVGSIAIIAGAASGKTDPGFLEFTPGEQALLGAILGIPVGALLGSATILFKHSKTYYISGEAAKWKIFVDDFNKLNP